MRHSTIVLSRSEDTSVERRAFEDACVRRLAERDSARVLVMPSLYSMTDAHPHSPPQGHFGRPRLRILAFPACRYWVLRAAGSRASSPRRREVPCRAHSRDRAYHLAPSRRRSLCLRVASCRRPLFQVRFPSRNPGRRRVPLVSRTRWRAASRVVSATTSAFSGLHAGRNRRPVVTAPDRCKPGCAACARICSEAAIIFPLCESDEGVAALQASAPSPNHRRRSLLRRSAVLSRLWLLLRLRAWPADPCRRASPFARLCCLCSASGACACRRSLPPPESPPPTLRTPVTTSTAHRRPRPVGC